MRYLIIYAGKIWYTDWFTIENNWEPGMITVDLTNDCYYMGGKWIEIEYDHL